jgi:hypothetical protein
LLRSSDASGITHRDHPVSKLCEAGEAFDMPVAVLSFDLFWLIKGKPGETPSI